MELIALSVIAVLALGTTFWLQKKNKSKKVVQVYENIESVFDNPDIILKEINEFEPDLEAVEINRMSSSDSIFDAIKVFTTLLGSRPGPYGR